MDGSDQITLSGVAVHSARKMGEGRNASAGIFVHQHRGMTFDTRQTICAFPALAGVLAGNALCYGYPAQ